jgi:hypothetical protein
VGIMEGGAGYGIRNLGFEVASRYVKRVVA